MLASRGALLLVVSVCLYVAHAVLFRDWLIDDAGISLAYARTLAEGHGLRAQPGVDPVEGFSNPLWTLLLAGSLRMGLHAALVPKLMGLLLVAAAFLVLVRACRRGSPSALAASLPLLLLPLNTSFVVWTISGLENPLLVALVVLSCALCLAAVRDPRERPVLDRSSGAVAGLLALTRPDAIVYAAAYPLVLLAFARREGFASLVRRLTRVASTFLPLVLGYALFRVLYFRELGPEHVPREGQAVASLAPGHGQAPRPHLEPGRSPDVRGGRARGRGARRRTVPSGSPPSPARAPPLPRARHRRLPDDARGLDGRVPLRHGLLRLRLLVRGRVLARVLASDLSSRRLRPSVAIAAPVLVAATAFLHGARSRDFAQNPVVPFSRVAAFSGRGYNRLADIVGGPGASLLTPDMGGTLFYSTMKVYDLAGLCDREIARTLRSDHPAFLRYVFDEVRPTFIHVHASWAEWADLSADPRLRRDYVAIAERHGGPAEWRRKAPARVPWSADYVRRDALAGDAVVLRRLRETFHAQGMPGLSP